MLYTLKNKINAFTSELDYRAKLVKYAPKLPKLSAEDSLILNTLKKEGAYITNLTDLGISHTPELLQAAYCQMSTMATVNNSSNSHRLPQIYTVTELSEFYNWGSNQRLMNIIENYLGLPVAFHGVHLRKDFANQHQFGTLLWHKDSEDRRMIKVIIYLNDVEEKNGPFEFIPLSCTSFPLTNYRLNYQLKKSKYLGINDEQVKAIVPKSAWKSCTGKAGTVIIVDTGTALHHGTIRAEERATLFFAYTVNSPKRPDLCTQYWDDTFTKPILDSTSVLN
ncbi:MAG TPA: phytanoyl-CoA dioxygenase family protein [Nostocaceae cyanobacterium]|nr:phytanoyl-CoA dioxygenase family protein [Nostocaceae cyanobacterium]